MGEPRRVELVESLGADIYFDTEGARLHLIYDGQRPRTEIGLCASVAVTVHLWSDGLRWLRR